MRSPSSTQWTPNKKSLQSLIPSPWWRTWITRMSLLALLLSVVASAASTLSLQSGILSGCVSSDNNFLQSLGQLSSVTFLRSCLLNSHFGIALACWRTRQLWSHRWSHSRASFLAACTQHSGDWLFALPIASCGLQLDDGVVRVAVGQRLRLDLLLMLEASIALFARQSDTILWLTWLLVAFQQLAFPSSRNLQDYLNYMWKQ